MTGGLINHDRKWRRSAIVRDCRLTPLSNDWSLFDSASGLEIARIYAEDDLGGGWRWIIRRLRDGELVDSSSGWRETGKEAREYCEAQTKDVKYVAVHHSQINPLTGIDNSYITSARDSGHIYILSNRTMPGILKIGYTDRNPEDRARELYTTATPTPFVVEFAVKLLGNTFEIEQRVHNHLQKYRVDKRREFFRITSQEAANLIAEFIIKEQYIVIDTSGNIGDPFPDSHKRVAQQREFESREAAQKLVLENLRVAEEKKREQEKLLEIKRQSAIAEREELSKKKEFQRQLYVQWKKENSGMKPFDFIWCILWGFFVTQFGFVPLALLLSFLGVKFQFPLFLFFLAPIYKLITIFKEKAATGWGENAPDEFKDVAD